jgi:5-methylcytosine-specific restriction protein A
MPGKPSRAVMRQRAGLAKRSAFEMAAPHGVGGSAPRAPSTRTRTSTKASGSQDPRYGSWRWKRLREKVKAARPRCEGECRGYYASKYADHVIEVADDTSDANFFNEANIASLCGKCHYRKTKREAARRAGLREPKFGPVIRGCTVDGMPLDPDHWWNRE